MYITLVHEYNTSTCTVYYIILVHAHIILVHVHTCTYMYIKYMYGLWIDTLFIVLCEHFLVNGCQRTPKEDLIRLEIIQKVTDQSESLKSSSPQQRLSRYSRPGSSYVLSMSMDNDGIKETRKASLNTLC